MNQTVLRLKNDLNSHAFTGDVTLLSVLWLLLICIVADVSFLLLLFPVFVWTAFLRVFFGGGLGHSFSLFLWLTECESLEMRNRSGIGFNALPNKARAGRALLSLSAEGWAERGRASPKARTAFTWTLSLRLKNKVRSSFNLLLASRVVVVVVVLFSCMWMVAVYPLGVGPQAAGCGVSAVWGGKTLRFFFFFFSKSAFDFWHRCSRRAGLIF